MNIFPDDRIFEIISLVAERENVKAYVIGGYVRDHIMGRDHPDKDIDIVVLGDGTQLARAIAREISPDISVTVFKNFGTAMFRYKNYDIEFVGARKESYSRNSRKPSVKPGTNKNSENSKKLKSIKIEIRG